MAFTYSVSGAGVGQVCDIGFVFVADQPWHNEHHFYITRRRNVLERTVCPGGEESVSRGENMFYLTVTHLESDEDGLHTRHYHMTVDCLRRRHSHIEASQFRLDKYVVFTKEENDCIDGFIRRVR